MTIKLEVLVSGTPLAQRLDFAKVCYLQGLCTEQEYKKERVAIGKEVKKMIEQKLAHYANLVKGGMV